MTIMWNDFNVPIRNHLSRYNDCLKFHVSTSETNTISCSRNGRPEKEMFVRMSSKYQADSAVLPIFPEWTGYLGHADQV